MDMAAEQAGDAECQYDESTGDLYVTQVGVAFLNDEFIEVFKALEFSEVKTSCYGLNLFDTNNPRAVMTV